MTEEEWQQQILAAAHEAAAAFEALQHDASIDATDRDFIAERALLDLVTQRPANDTESETK